MPLLVFTITPAVLFVFRREIVVVVLVAVVAGQPWLDATFLSPLPLVGARRCAEASKPS